MAITFVLSHFWRFFGTHFLIGMRHRMSSTIFVDIRENHIIGIGCHPARYIASIDWRKKMNKARDFCVIVSLLQ